MFQSSRPVLIGVVHLAGTPGTPRYGGAVRKLLAAAEADARALAAGGADALVVENFGDVPFHRTRVPAETVATMALAVDAVQRCVGDLPVGVNVLRNDARAALGLCAATGAGFLRVNVHTGAAVTDQGIVEGRAAETIRERERLCPGVLLLADVFVKHATPLGVDPEDTGALGDAAEDTFRRGLADAIVVSGRATGRPPSVAALAAVRERLPDAPLLVGSGLDVANAKELLAHADGAICGTSLKAGARVDRPVDPERVARLRACLDGAG